MKISVAAITILLLQMSIAPSAHAQIFGRTPRVTRSGMFGPIPRITRSGMFGPVPHITIRRGSTEHRRIRELFSRPLGLRLRNR